MIKPSQKRQTPRCTAMVLGLSLLFSVSQVEAITLKRAVEETLRTNPEILSAWKNMRAVERAERQAFAAYFPTIDFTAGYGRDMNDNATTQATLGYPITLTRGEAGLTVNQTLFDGFQTQQQVRRARSTTQSAGFAFDNTAETVVWGAVQTYVDTLKLHETFELVKDNVLLHQRTLKKLQQKAKAGGGGKADVEQTMSKLAMASAGHASSQVALSNIRAHFTQVTGLIPRNLIRPTPPWENLPKTLDMASDRALLYHPRILAAIKDIKAAKAEKSAGKGAFMPRVGLGLGYTNTANMGGAVGHSQNASAMLNLQYNISRGGADKARVQELQERLGQRRDMLRIAQKSVREGVVVAWENLQATKERIRQLKKFVTFSRKTAATTQEQFKLGKKKLMDILGAENERFAAEVAFTTEDWTAIKAVYQLLASMGNLRQTLEVDGKKPSGTRPATQMARWKAPSRHTPDTYDQPDDLSAVTDPDQGMKATTATDTSEESTKLLAKLSTENLDEGKDKVPEKVAEEISAAEFEEKSLEEASEEAPGEDLKKTSKEMAEEDREGGSEEYTDQKGSTHPDEVDTADSTGQDDTYEEELVRPHPMEGYPEPSTIATENVEQPWTHANAASLHVQSSGDHAPLLVLSGQYAVSGSSVLIFTQLVRVEDNRVISSVTEEVPLTWRLKKILGLATPTLKVISRSTAYPPIQTTESPFYNH